MATQHGMLQWQRDECQATWQVAMGTRSMLAHLTLQWAGMKVYGRLVKSKQGREGDRSREELVKGPSSDNLWCSLLGKSPNYACIQRESICIHNGKIYGPLKCWLVLVSRGDYFLIGPKKNILTTKEVNNNK